MILPEDQLKTIILDFGLSSEKDFENIKIYASENSIGLQDAIVEKGIVSENHLCQLIANQLNIPFIKLANISISEDVLKIIPQRLARKYKVVAFDKTDSYIKLAVSDSLDDEMMQMISKKTGGVRIERNLVTKSDLLNTLRLYHKDLNSTISELIKSTAGDINNMSASNAPIVRIIETLIQFAYLSRASDIHIEAEENDVLIRFRIDGVLHDVLKLPKSLQDQLVTRIKVLATLRTDEHYSPQDGKIRMIMEDENENIDIRISIIPTVDGEKTVARLLASHSRQLSLSDLGLNQKDLFKINSSMFKPYGMILSTGPTGSGKTTAIYSILKILNTRDKNITTIEDPVEYKIKGLNQIQVNPKTNLTFASGLRSILRQDPNIVFVGEIRDKETAEIAVNAALTGHLVLSTLHTNDSPTALPRLIDMGVEPFLVASTINIIMAQRLLRKICDMCKISSFMAYEELVKNVPKEKVSKYFGAEKNLRVFKGRGCKFCHNTGYSGRVGIFEVLEVSKEIKKLISLKQDSNVILKQALSEGMSTMLDDGLQKAAKGITTIEEVLRVTKFETV